MSVILPFPTPDGTRWIVLDKIVSVGSDGLLRQSEGVQSTIYTVNGWIACQHPADHVAATIERGAMTLDHNPNEARAKAILDTNASVIREWANGGHVNADELLAELRRWVQYFAVGMWKKEGET